MKFIIDLAILTPFLLFGSLTMIIDCKTIQSQPQENKRSFSTSKVLRLTYDSTWNPKSDFYLRESGKSFGNGNSYIIDYAAEEKDFPWLKISSTDQENKHSFKYLLQEQGNDPIKVYYFPWQSSRISVLLKSQTSTEKRIQCRWEGAYKGYLIIVESEFYNIDGLSYPEIAHKFQNHILASLTLY